MSNMAKSAIKESIKDLEFALHEIYLSREEEVREKEVQDLEKAIEYLKSLL